MTPSYAFPEWRRSSDGVFAIAITLLVLELSIPEGSDGHLLGAVLNLWPSYRTLAVRGQLIHPATGDEEITLLSRAKRNEADHLTPPG